MLLRALHKLKEISVLFAEAQIGAGADGLTYPDHATGDLVSGKTYKRFLLEIHKEMAQRIKAPLFLHICGNTMDRMEYIAQTGMAAYHFDSKNPAEKAVGLVNGRIKLVGNINNPVTLLTKGPEEVRAEVFRALDAGVDMIGPECAVPLTTKLQNLLAISQAVKAWAARKQTPV
jgi:[methyl-Co(III) methanol-specific corrinoid protein]:coenzyme M methyltransferase